MLSYFLDSNGVSSPPSTTSSGLISGSSHSPVVSDRILQHPFRTSFQGNGRTIRQQQDKPSLNLSNDVDVDDDHKRPPPTPVIQHYFPSSHKYISKSSSGQTGPSKTTTITSSGIHLSRQIQQLPQPYLQHYHQHYHHQNYQQQQHLQHQYQYQHRRQLDSIHSMKAISIGQINNPLTSHFEDNFFAFQGYNPGMEEGVSPIIPALEFIGKNEPPVVSGNEEIRQGSTWTEGIPPQMNTTTNENSTVIQTSNFVTDNNSLHQVHATVGPATMTSATPVAPQIPLQLHHSAATSNREDLTTQVISSDLSANAFTSNVASLHPVHVAAAALPAGLDSPFFFPHVSIAYLRQKVESIEETEEKRAKRLQLNRESARKSRRRKKERLSNIEDKVSRLYKRLETERRSQINSMLNSSSENFEMEQLLQLKKVCDSIQGEQEEDRSYDDERVKKTHLQFLIDQVESSIRKEVVDFQYNSLNQHILQRYQKFLLWLIMQPESHLISGKEEHYRRKQSEKISTGKISSKQLGEELSNGRKVEGETSQKKDEENSYQVAQSSDAGRMWSLLCFELSISVEQEDRLLQSHKGVREGNSFRRDVAQISLATRLTSNLKEAVLYQLHLSSFRKRKTYLDILTPQQTILYQEWLLSNRDRSKEVLKDKQKTSSSSSNTNNGRRSSLLCSISARDENLILEQLCRCLEESLKVTKK